MPRTKLASKVAGEAPATPKKEVAPKEDAKTAPAKTASTTTTRRRRGAPTQTKKPAAKLSGELLKTVNAMKKEYGDTIITPATEKHQPDRISTGSFTLDFATLGGIPHNRCSMIIGERSAGKSTLAAKIIGNAQLQYPNQTPVLLDIEGTFDEVWAEKLGVNTNTLQTVQCETGEMACDIGEAMVRSQECSLLVVDSLAALTPMKEIESSAEDANVALQARLLGAFIRKVNSALIEERKRGHMVTLLFLNQWRTKIGGMSYDNRSVPGGKAVEFSTSLQIDIKNRESVGRNADAFEEMLYNEHPWRITKNKLNNGPRTGEFRLVRSDSYDPELIEGDVDDAQVLLSYAKKFGIYGGGGSKWTLALDKEELTFGKAAEAISMLREDPDKYWELRCILLRLQAKHLGMRPEFIKRIK